MIDLAGSDVRCLSLWEPYASLMALGLKTIETRSWSTSHRGPVVICASRHWDDESRDLCEGHWPIADILPPGWAPQIGMAVAVGTLCDCVTMSEAGVAARERLAAAAGDDLSNPAVLNYHLGYWDQGRFAWCFTELCAVEPVPVRGAMGLFAPPEGLIERLCPLRVSA